LNESDNFTKTTKIQDTLDTLATLSSFQVTWYKSVWYKVNVVIEHNCPFFPLLVLIVSCVGWQVKRNQKAGWQNELRKTTKESCQHFTDFCHNFYKTCYIIQSMLFLCL
jgi:hypothetical protein